MKARRIRTWITRNGRSGILPLYDALLHTRTTTNPISHIPWSLTHYHPLPHRHSPPHIDIPPPINSYDLPPEMDQIWAILLMFRQQLQIYNFYKAMTDQPNFPSSEEISFKLTQNLIPSFANSKGTLIPLESSLEYTYSRISIQNMLIDEAPPLQSLEKLDHETFSKNSSLKASSVRTAAESDIKHTPRTSFRERVVSSKKSIRKTSLQKGGSFQVFEFQKANLKTSLIHCEPRKSKSEIRKKSFSIRRETTLTGSLSDVKTLQRTNSRRNCEEDELLLDLKKSMHIKQIKLRADQERERNYMKRILQNRMCSIHPLEDMTHSTPLWTSRKAATRN